MRRPPSHKNRTIVPSIVRYRHLITVAIFLGIALAAVEYSGVRAQFTLNYVQERVGENRGSGLLVFFLLFAIGNLIQIPGWVFLAAAVLVLGRTWGGVATYVAACFSCTLTYGLLGLLGKDALRQLENRVARDILARIDRQPVVAIVLLRTLFQTAPALNYTLALSGIRFKHYVIGTLLGLPLPIALYCAFFEYLARALGIQPILV